MRAGMSASPLLATYLNDHLAGSVAGVELAKRAARNNRGSRYGEILADLVPRLQEDRRALEGVMSSLGVGVDRGKLAIAWWAEKLGRAKLNGRLFAYSPLSRLEELEFLLLGVEGKLLLWQSLRRLAERDERLSATHLDALIRAARAQRRRVAEQRNQAADEALAG
jgi:hypothetical protein